MKVSKIVPNLVSFRGIGIDNSNKPFSLYNENFKKDINTLSGDVTLGYGSELEGNINTKTGDITIADSIIKGNIVTEDGEVKLQNDVYLNGNINTAKGDVFVYNNSTINGNINTQKGNVGICNNVTINGSIDSLNNINIINSKIKGVIYAEPRHLRLENAVVKDIYFRPDSEQYAFLNESLLLGLQEKYENARPVIKVHRGQNITTRGGFDIICDDKGTTVITPDNEVFYNGKCALGGEYETYRDYKMCNLNAPNIIGFMWSSIPKKSMEEANKPGQSFTIPAGCEVTGTVYFEQDNAILRVAKGAKFSGKASGAEVIYDK